MALLMLLCVEGSLRTKDLDFEKCLEICKAAEL